MIAAVILGLVILLAIGSEVKAWGESSRVVTPPTEITGAAAWYGERYRGKRMANGDPFDPQAMTCATWEWPIGSRIRVIYFNPVRGTSENIIVTVTDRGPSKSLHRVIDLSQGAFSILAPLRLGVIPVRVELVEVGGAK